MLIFFILILGSVALAEAGLGTLSKLPGTELLAGGGILGGGKGCDKVECKPPPEGGDCKVIPESDKSVPRPQAKYGECCPLWKCEEKDGKGFYTFHGLKRKDGKDEGGSEIVKYGRSESGSNIVSSVATGTHNALAIATSDGGPMGSMPNMDDFFKGFKSAFGVLG